MAPFPKLVVRHGPNKDHEYVLTMNTSIVGREPINDVVFADPEISRRHARIVAQAGSYYIEDLGSTNGTFVNGRRIHAVTRLSDNDIVDLGESIRVTFLHSADAVSAEPEPELAPLDDTEDIPEESLEAIPASTMVNSSATVTEVQYATDAEMEMELYEDHQTTRRQMYFLIGGIAIVVLLCACTAVFIALTYGTQIISPT